MKSIKIDRILEAVAHRVYRAEYRVEQHGQPFVMPSFSDLAELVERLKSEGSYDADDNLALFGVPNVFAPLGEVPAYKAVKTLSHTPKPTVYSLPRTKSLW